MQAADGKDMQRPAVAKGIFDLIIRLGRDSKRHGTEDGNGLRVFFEVLGELPADPLPAKFRPL